MEKNDTLSQPQSRHAPELPTGPAVLRLPAFRDMPPTLYFSDGKFPKDCFKPGSKYSPLCQYTGIRTVALSTVLRAGGFRLEYRHVPGFDMVWGKITRMNNMTFLFPYQRINQFRDRSELGRKDYLGSNLNLAARRFPEVYDYHPKTYIIPSDLQTLIDDYKAKIEKGEPHVYIKKPSAMSRGRDITLIDEIPENLDPCVVQNYIDSPLLINGLKFDMRIYALVTSFDPLRVYVFKDGLVRLATEKYLPYSQTKKEDVTFTHLTNYSLNKDSKDYHAPKSDKENDSDSKWSFVHFHDYIKKMKSKYKNDKNNPYNKITYEGLWRDINDKVAKTLAAVSHRFTKQKNEKSKRNYVDLSKNISTLDSHCSIYDDKKKKYNFVEDIKKSKKMNEETKENFLYTINDVCFELYGFDFMLDENGKVWIIEVNVTPATSGLSSVDKAVKLPMLRGLFNIVGFNRDCGMDYDSITMGSKKDVKELRRERKLKESVAEFYRSIGTGWTRVFPVADPFYYHLLRSPTVHDKDLLDWCMKPGFDETLSTVRDEGKKKILENESLLKASIPIHGQTTKIKRTKDISVPKKVSIEDKGDKGEDL